CEELDCEVSLLLDSLLELSLVACVSFLPVASSIAFEYIDCVPITKANETIERIVPIHANSFLCFLFTKKAINPKITPITARTAAKLLTIGTHDRINAIAPITIETIPNAFFSGNFSMRNILLCQLLTWFRFARILIIYQIFNQWFKPTW